MYYLDEAHYALRDNSEALGRAVLLYLGYSESLDSGERRTSFTDSELDEIAGRWSGSYGANNFSNEIEAHADMLVDGDIRARTARTAWLAMRPEWDEARYFDAVAVADMARDDTGADKFLMDFFWQFRLN